LKRGTTTKYLLENSSEEIVNNSLSGLLIKFLRENGPQNYQILLKLVTSQYSIIRKLSGHRYTGDIKRALKGALTANGLFTQLDSDFNAEGESNSSNFFSQNLSTVWKVVEPVTSQYLIEKQSQVEQQKQKLMEKRRYNLTKFNHSSISNPFRASGSHIPKHYLQRHRKRAQKEDLQQAELSG
jgi:hypothetical protein